MSHILSEFAYKPVYDEKHRMVAFNPENVDRKWPVQSGFKERLLCDDCEQYLNKSFEEPFCEFWFRRKPLEQRPDDGVPTLEGIDYARFKLFHLSVLWRASVSKHEAFCRVNLGPHNETIRRMLLESRPGHDWEYPIICAAIINGSSIQYNIVTSPQRLKFESQSHYLFTFGGCQWLYCVSSHRNAWIESRALKETGSLPVFRQDLEALFRFWHKGAMRLGNKP